MKVELDIIPYNEVTKEDKLYKIYFCYDSGEKRLMRLSEEAYKALGDHFKPKEITASSAEFDELWKLHPKGNKATAKQRLPKVLKKIKFEDLKALLIPYTKSNDFVYLKGLDVWLNPIKEHWNDPIVAKAAPKKEEIKTKPSFFES